MEQPIARRPAGRAPENLIADDRERFLTGEPLEPKHVRNPILLSWERSRDLKVDADQIHQEYSTSVDVDTPLTRSANQVLRDLSAQLADQPISIILTDATGLVLLRRSGGGLDRYLDRVQLAPGFRYAEENVGTNGIGLALEAGGPAYVFGHEHYAEGLEGLSCAGVPIRHPVTGRTVGVLDLTCWSKDAGPLLVTLAKNTTDQIQQALRAAAGANEMAVLQEYLRTCQRLPGIVFAITGETVILNDQARSALDPADQASLLAHANESLVGNRRGSIRVDLPSGADARMYSRSVGEDGGGRGAVVHVKLGARSGRTPTAHERTQRMPLPGLVGSDPLWRRACHRVEEAVSSGEWLVVTGEPGVGKLALLQAAQLRHQPIRRIEVFEAREAVTDPDWSGSVRAALDGRTTGVIVRHADVLNGQRLRDLRSMLHSARQSGVETPLWVAITVSRVTDDMGGLLSLFPTTTEVPPLRLHLGDVPSLVSFFLGRLRPSEHLTCADEVMDTLTRGAWPGNIKEVYDVLTEVVRHRRSGQIQLSDLPPAVRSVSRRRLSLLEAMQRDAVVNALIDSKGDKSAAAKALGISRATIYRKIHDYGILTLPTHARGDTGPTPDGRQGR